MITFSKIDVCVETQDCQLWHHNVVNIYLNPPMPNPEYMCLQLDIIPNKIIIHYKLCNIVTPDGLVYIKIHEEMYGLPQASIFAN